MKNLPLITEQIRKQYEGCSSFVIPPENVSLTDKGLLDTSKNQFPITREGLGQFAGYADAPKPFFLTLEPDLQAAIFNRRFQARLSDRRIPRRIRINLNQQNEITGFDDSKLFRTNPVKLMDTIISTLPKTLSAEKISVARADIGPNMMHISCFSPQSATEPQRGDIINGGIDILHCISGNAGTQISCYLRRLVCSNGATAHICAENTSLRVRRLSNNQFDESDMLSQIHDRLTHAWSQIDEKLNAIKALTQQKRILFDFLEQQRSRFSLNKHMLDAISLAINQDELGPTNTAYDTFNAISRVATHHENLTFRQQRTLSRLAGEFSQQEIHKCDKCGSWLAMRN
jgi:hypothetical protein